VTYIENWDSGLPGAFWDSNLQWDVSVGPSPGDVDPYLRLITSEHRDKPKFTAMVAALVQPLADLQVLLAGMPGLYDLDACVGQQEDTTGQWIGITRDVTVPLTYPFFSWSVSGLGWGQADWISSVDATQLVTLSDAAYRTLLYAKVAANQWDGTVPGAYAVYATVFSGTGTGVLIQDYGDMHMALALTGPVPDAVTLSLFVNGYLDLKPAGVRIDAYYAPAEADVPYFGWGTEGSGLAGWGVGYWGTRYAGS